MQPYRDGKHDVVVPKETNNWRPPRKVQPEEHAEQGEYPDRQKSKNLRPPGAPGAIACPPNLLRSHCRRQHETNDGRGTNTMLTYRILDRALLPCATEHIEVLSGLIDTETVFRRVRPATGSVDPGCELKNTTETALGD